MMMALLKIARIKKGKNVDSYVDLAGYAACAGEIATDTASVKFATPCGENVDTCVSCGAIIPEGYHVCLSCAQKDLHDERT